MMKSSFGRKEFAILREMRILLERLNADLNDIKDQWEAGDITEAEKDARLKATLKEFNDKMSFLRGNRTELLA